MLLARFAPGELTAALNLASAWARRYDELVLAEVVVAGEPANILVRWESGKRLAAV